MKWIRYGHYGHIQLWRQLGKDNHFFKLDAQIKDMGFYLLVLFQLHLENFNLGS